MKQSSGRALHTFPLRFPGHFYLPQPPSPKPEAGRVSQPRLPRSSYLDCWGSNPGCPACLSSVLPERSRCITHSSRSTPGRSRSSRLQGQDDRLSTHHIHAGVKEQAYSDVQRSGHGVHERRIDVLRYSFTENCFHSLPVGRLIPPDHQVHWWSVKGNTNRKEWEEIIKIEKKLKNCTVT